MRRNAVRFSAVAAVTIALAGCSRTDPPEVILPPPAGFVMVDPTELPLYETEEELRIKSDEVARDGLDRTVNTGSLALLADGSIVLKQLRSSTIQVFDSSGQFVHSFERRGEGPGEFLRITDIASVGKHIVASGNRGEFGVFNVRGDLQFALRPARIVDLTQLSAGGDVAVAILAGGTVLRSKEWRTGRGTQSIRDSVLHFLADTAGNTVKRLYLYRDATTRDILVPVGRDSSRVPQAIGTSPLTLVAPGGDRVFLVFGSAVTGEQPGHLRVLESDPVGNVTIHDYLTQANPVPPGFADSVARARAAGIIERARMTGRSVTRSASDLAADIRSQLHVPTHFPEYESGRAAADGSLWLRLTSDSAFAFTVFRDGKPVRRVLMPDRFFFDVFGGDRIWGFPLDTADVPLDLVRRRVVPKKPD